ncbi:MAG: DnaB-like helicase C-terminal domain-containing protein, partial [Planctomycetota bacterium]
MDATKVQRDKIPQTLRECAQWVLWKTTLRNDKPTKVPFQPCGAEAKSNTPSTWNTFDAVWSVYERGGYDGVGFMFSADDDFAGIDLDGCRDPETGKVADWARDVILKLDSYAEVSPSQTGVKVFVRGASPFDSGKNTKLPNEPAVSDKEPGIEIYDHKRYFAVTGHKLNGPAEPQERDLTWIKDRFWPERKPEQAAGPRPNHTSSDGPLSVLDRARRYIDRMPPAVSGKNGSNVTYHVACVLVLGFGLSDEDAMAVLREYSSRCQPPWSEKELLHKLDGAKREPGERNYLRDAQPAEWDRVAVPRYREPRQTPRHEPRRTTLKEAAEKYIGKIKANDCNLIRLGIPGLDAAIGGGVEKGELVIVGARPSHGKSAVALQAIHHATAVGMPSLIISEEMNALSLGKRTLQFLSNTPQESWAQAVEHLEQEAAEHFENRTDCYVVEGCRNVDTAVEEIRNHVEKKAVELVAVDYAQLLVANGKSRYEEATAASIALRQVASECN